MDSVRREALEEAIRYIEAQADELQGQGLDDHWVREVLLRLAEEMRRDLL